MSYKICKKTDGNIILQDTGFIFGIVLASVGAGIMYLSWFNYQDTGEILISFVFLLLGSCFFFPMFKNNRLTIDAENKEVIKTKSWFGITTNKEVVTNRNLSLLEMSGFTSGEFEAFFDSTERTRHHYSLKFYSYPEWNLLIRSFSTMLDIMLFIEQHFDTDLALVIQHKRHKFSAKGLLKNHQKTPLPNDSTVKETGFQELRIASTRGGIIRQCAMPISLTLWAIMTSGFLLYLSALEGFTYIPVAVQYLTAFIFSSGISLLVINNFVPTRLKIDHGSLVVKNSLFGHAKYPLPEVIGVVNVAKITYLITHQGSEQLAYKIPTKYSYAIHSWLLPFLSK
ncbi:hypothetical protein FM038_020835 [Shewanella eurypsychrophilus]|uniref:Uncharacterized protein n=1 Tax=Shewanella eurypsychrophilus TaxID=2593656 RepID=A0ABX6VAS3_9GAMM|nr:MULTISPECIES: hypothetical protein [Shewanella]QFU24352.1 hypothetical protein FS418_22540 [Shewanella sp. YLB-09]QPG59552.1 hypothetical protein FM038_020835 [Shewanella eurypsychrophilus]